MLPEIILVHGWDPAKYNASLSTLTTISSDVGWDKSPDLVALLGAEFNLKYCNLPGFCGVAEPEKKSYSLDDFADYMLAWKNSYSPSAKLILSYSFGGAVSLFYKVKYQDNIPLILVSPAIIRKESLKSKIAQVAKIFIPNSLKENLKSRYQEVASEYYRKGSPFLRLTYDDIVRQDLSYLVDKIPIGEALFIFGTGDQETPWELIRDYIIKFRHDHLVIEKGGHSLVKTHSQELFDAINKFMDKKNAF